MRFELRQRILSWGKQFDVFDEAGNAVYVVAGQVFSVGDRLSFRDCSGAELAVIRQKIPSLGLKYRISRPGQSKVLVKRKRFAVVHHTFDVDVPRSDGIQAKGNFFDNEYTFRRGETEVASVSRQWFTWSDAYGIDIADGEDHILLLACAVVIDLACHSYRRS